VVGGEGLEIVGNRAGIGEPRGDGTRDAMAGEALRLGKASKGREVERNLSPDIVQMDVDPVSDGGVVVGVTGDVPLAQVEGVTARVDAVDAFHMG
jgi:hypothetical protein